MPLLSVVIAVIFVTAFVIQVIARKQLTKLQKSMEYNHLKRHVIVAIDMQIAGYRGQYETEKAVDMARSFNRGLTSNRLPGWLNLEPEDEEIFMAVSSRYRKLNLAINITLAVMGICVAPFFTATF
jgi:hypothetical protein